MKKSICFAGFANDELESLKQAMSGIRGTWDCTFTENAKAALDTMADKPFDAVVANMHMTGMNGAELLHRVGDLHPTALRFVVGDMADQELILDCIGGTHQFIARPFRPQEFISTVQRSLALDACLSSNALRKLAPKLRRLPSLPSTYFEVLKQVESPNTTVQSVGEVIARDPAATARLLQMVNSAAFALAQKVTDPVDAVSLLGLETVKSLVLCLQVFSQSDEAKRAGLSLEQLWDHSFAVAKMARQIVQHHTGDARLSNDAFTAGLLHDVGRIVIASNLPKEYAAVVAAARQKSCPLHEEEEAQLEVTHAQVGAYLLGLWGMPATLVEAAGLHHTPGHTSSHEFSLLTAVHVADVFAHEQDTRKDGLTLPQLDLAYLNLLGLSKKTDVWRSLVAGEKAAASDTERISEPLPKSKPAPKPQPSQKPLPRPAPAPAGRSDSGRFFNLLIPAAAVIVIVAAMVWWHAGSRFNGTTPIHARAVTDPALAPSEPAPTTTPVPPAADAKHEVAPAAQATSRNAQVQPATDAKHEVAPGTQATSGNAQVTGHASKGTALNPDIAASAAASGFQSVKVQGIFYSAGNSSAIINGKSLSVGERVNGVEVLSIGPTTVVLSCNGERRAFKVQQ
jgi:HD-like signal output (HDOD) protein